VNDYKRTISVLENGNCHHPRVIISFDKTD